MTVIHTRTTLLQRLMHAYRLRARRGELRDLAFSIRALKRGIRADAQVLARQSRMGYRDAVLATRHEIELHELAAMRQRRQDARAELRRLRAAL